MRACCRLLHGLCLERNMVLLQHWLLGMGHGLYEVQCIYLGACYVHSLKVHLSPSHSLL